MAWKPVKRYTLVAPSADGTCCPCAALSDPCTCAGLAAEVRCRTRSALAVLIGYQAFIAPENPPRTWLMLTGAGATQRCNHWDSECANVQGSDSEAWSGYNSYDARTGAKTIASNADWHQSFGSCPPTTFIGSGAMPENLGAAREQCEYVVTLTPQRATLTAQSGSCCPDGTGKYSRWTGQRTLTLSREYTERAALDRAWNSPAGPVPFGDWSAPLTEWPACSALWELRAGAQDFDFAVRESQYQLRFPALTVTRQVVDPYTGETTTETTQVTAQVEVRIDILRRPWSGGIWVLYRTETYTLTATGGQTFEADVPNERGYETAINNVRYRLLA